MNNNYIRIPLPKFTIFFCKICDFVSAIKVHSNFLLKELRFINSIEYFNEYFQKDIYNGESKKIVFSPINNSEITIFTSNQTDGANSIVFIINEFLKKEAISISTSWGGRWMDFYAMEYWQDGKSVRYVRSMQDPRWEFYERGNPLWFEDIELYKQRMIKKRMNKDILIDYCNKLGFNIDDKCFWQNSGSIYELT